MLERVSSDLLALQAAGLNVRLVALNVAENSIDVSLGSPDDSAEPQLQARYGDAVRVVGVANPAATDRTNDGVPFKGGIEIYDTRFSCTSAFVMRRSTGNTLTPFDYFMLTAGHCFPRGTTVNHFIYTVGTVVENSYPGINGGSTTDAELIDIAPGTESRQLLRSNPSTYVTMTGQLLNNTDFRAGDPSCRVGKTSGYACGTIVNPDASFTFNDGGSRSLTRQVVASIDACPGDSGGAAYRGTTAMGVTFGRTDGLAACGAADQIYSKISEVTRVHRVQVNR